MSFDSKPYLRSKDWFKHGLTHGFSATYLYGRHTGISTARAFSLLSEGIHNPGIEFKVEDHYQKEQAHNELFSLLQRIVRVLELDGWTLNRSKKTIKFTLDEE